MYPRLIIRKDDGNPQITFILEKSPITNAPGNDFMIPMKNISTLSMLGPNLIKMSIALENVRGPQKIIAITTRKLLLHHPLQVLKRDRSLLVTRIQKKRHLHKFQLLIRHHPNIVHILH